MRDEKNLAAVVPESTFASSRLSTILVATVTAKGLIVWSKNLITGTENKI